MGTPDTSVLHLNYMMARPHQRYIYPDKAEVPNHSGLIRESHRATHFNNIDLPEPSSIGNKRPREPSPVRSMEPNKLMRYTNEGQAYDDGSVLPEGLVYREIFTQEKLPWYNNPFHPKFIPSEEQDKAHGPFLPGKNSNSEDPYGEAS